MTNYLHNFFHNFKLWLSQFNRGQKLYLAALFVFVLFIFDETDDYTFFYLSGWIALAGMVADIWPGFIRVWNTFIGRVVVLVTYAIVANIAVAVAYQELNEIVGIDPSPLFYSLGFMILLIAPAFILTITMLVMLVVWMWQQTVFLVNLFLKLIRLKSFKLNSQIKHPTTTAFIKLFLIVPIVGAIISGFQMYDGINISGVSVGQRCYDDNGKTINCGTVSQAFIEGVKHGWNEEKERQKQAENADGKEVTTAETTPADENAESDNTSEQVAKEQPAAPKEKFNMAKVVAGFVFEMELYERTQCVQAPDEKAMFIGEYDIFVARPNDQNPVGYDFYVRNCVVRSY